MSAFERAFAVLKMPIDWDTVTEPVWTPTKKNRSTFSTNITQAHSEDDKMDGEASAQWIHPETGERYDIRMDKWIRNTLHPNDGDLEQFLLEDENKQKDLLSLMGLKKPELLSKR